jgi:uncharacterized protein (TIGR00730 family)
MPQGTTPTIHSVAVFCASSHRCPPALFDAARSMGKAIGRHGLQLVYGGTNVGLMKELADAAHAAGARVVGVIPRFMQENGIAGLSCHELLLVEDMRQRKSRMEELADAFVVLPGGIGTLEEFFEILTLKQLGLHNKPIVLLNRDGYWQPMLAMLRAMIDMGVAKESLTSLYAIAENAEEVFALLEGYRAPTIPSKWA